MSQRNKQFMSLYQKYRFEDQRGFYDRTSKEFKAAHQQVISLTGVIMIFTAAVSALTAAVTSSDWKPVLAILAVVFPALSTALSAYNELFAFERQSKLYQDAEKALHHALAGAPDLKPGISDSDYDGAVGVYVNVIEGIFRKEQGQWGQLESQAKTVELPAEKAQTLVEKSTDTPKQSAPGTPDAPGGNK
jgi:hypothetical protein